MVEGMDCEGLTESPDELSWFCIIKAKASRRPLSFFLWECILRDIVIFRRKIFARKGAPLEDDYSHLVRLNSTNTKMPIFNV